MIEWRRTFWNVLVIRSAWEQSAWIRESTSRKWRLGREEAGRLLDGWIRAVGQSFWSESDSLDAKTRKDCRYQGCNFVTDLSKKKKTKLITESFFSSLFYFEQPFGFHCESYSSCFIIWDDFSNSNLGSSRCLLPNVNIFFTLVVLIHYLYSSKFQIAAW